MWCHHFSLQRSIKSRPAGMLETDISAERRLQDIVEGAFKTPGIGAPGMHPHRSTLLCAWKIDS